MDYSVYGVLQARISQWDFPYPGDLPNPRIKPRSPPLQAEINVAMQKQIPWLCTIWLLLFSHTVLSDSLQLHEHQHAMLPCPTLSPRVWQIHVHWVGDTIQPSHPLSSLSPALNLSQHQSFPTCWLFSSDGQSTRASALVLVLPMNIHGWFPLELTGLISLVFKGLSRAFSSTTVWKHQFFGTQPFFGSTLTSIYDYWKDHSFDYMDLCWQCDISAF